MYTSNHELALRRLNIGRLKGMTNPELNNSVVICHHILL